MMSLRVVPFRSVAVQAIRLLSSTGIVLIALGCSSPTGPDEKGDVLTVVNRTSSTLVVFPFVDGTLVDPVTNLPPGTFDENMIRPGRSLAIDSISGYNAGHDVDLFLYIVQPDHSAMWLGNQRVLASEILQQHGIVRITALPRM